MTSQQDTIEKLCMYELKVPNKGYRGPQTGLYQLKGASQEEFKKIKVRLNLSGGQLMVKTGGGFTLFVEYLA